MICHNTKNGFPSAILNEEYTVSMVRICTPGIGEKPVIKRVNHDVTVTHDMFGSSLAIRLKDETIVITIDKIINDILEVEHENETLYADR